MKSNQTSVTGNLFRVKLEGEYRSCSLTSSPFSFRLNFRKSGHLRKKTASEGVKMGEVLQLHQHYDPPQRRHNAAGAGEIMALIWVKSGSVCVCVCAAGVPTWFLGAPAFPLSATATTLPTRLCSLLLLRERSHQLSSKPRCGSRLCFIRLHVTHVKSPLFRMMI